MGWHAQVLFCTEPKEANEVTLHIREKLIGVVFSKTFTANRLKRNVLSLERTYEIAAGAYDKDRKDRKDYICPAA